MTRISSHTTSPSPTFRTGTGQVVGVFKVSTINDDISGEGDVRTVRLADVDEIHVKKVGTGESIVGSNEKEAGFEDASELTAR